MKSDGKYMDKLKVFALVDSTKKKNEIKTKELQAFILKGCGSILYIIIKNLLTYIVQLYIINYTVRLYS